MNNITKAMLSITLMAVRDLGYSKARALEQIGESDPQTILAQARAEQVEEAHFEAFRRGLVGEVVDKPPISFGTEFFV